ncbi:uncharacterized protein BCR38DRAFT_319823, partial [Pseudomassariella vexata]
MENHSKYSTHRPAGREHFPHYPKGFIAVRILQLIITVVCLGLCGYGVTFLVFSGDALMLFTAVATLISCIYHLVAEFGSPNLYNYWAVMALDIFLLIFWLISFALLASQIAPVFDSYTSCDAYDYCYSYSLTDAELIYAACLAGAAGLGGLEFVLFIVSLAIHSVGVHRHRKAGLHNTPVASTTAHKGAPAATAASAGGEKIQMQPQSQPYSQQTPGTSQAQGFPQHSAQSPSPSQQVYTAPQQQFYPQQVPSPLSAQQTGSSFQQ